ncbi:hypothetical protein MNEG_2257 [Monoraphidium neglectum]|uniref:Uncharacterized protein n=1 Tax=Monoraphidium neglectum TaxID=145388 RepID=A0A0D2MT30_9CHLO|nr:hypothetical protein MNEG_2257 [Monoraphidium neglectum]KIZ05695.1 hypothetical protein MNEG_2257 [Monoraphidium neglectum]|eukprot:XP_013904714.1 hypothetical protein MNEG_2257 [Monoraphidium neglectum]
MHPAAKNLTNAVHAAHNGTLNLLAGHLNRTKAWGALGQRLLNATHFPFLNNTRRARPATHHNVSKPAVAAPRHAFPNVTQHLPPHIKGGLANVTRHLGRLNVSRNANKTSGFVAAVQARLHRNTKPAQAHGR